MTKLTVRNDCPFYGTIFKLDAKQYPRQYSTFYNRCYLNPGQKCKPTQTCSDILDGKSAGPSWADCQEVKLIFV